MEIIAHRFVITYVFAKVTAFTAEVASLLVPLLSPGRCMNLLKAYNRSNRIKAFDIPSTLSLYKQNAKIEC